MSRNVKVFGSFHFAESCTFDPDRNVIVAMNAANPRDQGIRRRSSRTTASRR